MRHALQSFVEGHAKAPATTEVSWKGPDVRLLPVQVKVPFGMARRGGYIHVVRDAAAVAEGDRVRFGARWACWGGSNDALFLCEASGQTECPHCYSARGVTVYRCFGAGGNLLYVGCTINPLAQRLRSHKSTAPWWHEVEDVTSEQHGSLPAGRVAELKAILAEDPVHNRWPQTRSRVEKSAITRAPCECSVTEPAA